MEGSSKTMWHKTIESTTDRMHASVPMRLAFS